MDLKLADMPLEKIVRVDHFAAVFNSDRMLRDRKFLVDLACGHKLYTGAKKQARCPRCCEMLRRSIADGSEYYESFRAWRIPDRMVWREDPSRQFNEKTDLAGNFVND
jgi:hypothetical protein